MKNSQYAPIDAIKVNGRSYFPDHLSDFKTVSRGKYSVDRYGMSYTIEGGRHAGGKSRGDWFVECAEWAKPIVCDSLIDAIRMLDGM